MGLLGWIARKVSVQGHLPIYVINLPISLERREAKRDGVRVSERADGSQRAGSIQRAAAGK